MNQGDLCPKCRVYYTDGLGRCPVCDPKPTRATAARESVEHDCATSGHLYDDDWPWPDQADMRPLAPGSRVGDPCIWCDHNKQADEPEVAGLTPEPARSVRRA